MTPHQFIGLSVRLFAIWLALQSAPYLLLATGNSMPYGATGYYFLGGFFVGVAVLLWFFPLTVANKLLPRGGDEPRITDKPEELVQVALIVAGIVLVAVRGPRFLWYVLRWFLIRVSGIQHSEMDIEVNAEVLVTLAQVIGGFILVLKANAVATWITPKRRN